MDRPDDLDDRRLAGRVLEWHADEHEDKEADSDDVGHDPIADESGFLGRVHDPLNVASVRPLR